MHTSALPAHEAFAALAGEVKALRRRLHSIEQLMAALLPPLPAKDLGALSTLLPLFTIDLPMLAEEIFVNLAGESDPHGTSRHDLNQLLKGYTDLDGGCRRFGHLLKRCRGRVVDGRYIEVVGQQSSGLLYLVRSLD